MAGVLPELHREKANLGVMKAWLGSMRGSVDIWSSITGLPRRDDGVARQYVW